MNKVQYQSTAGSWIQLVKTDQAGVTVVATHGVVAADWFLLQFPRHSVKPLPNTYDRHNRGGIGAQFKVEHNLTRTITISSLATAQHLVIG